MNLAGYVAPSTLDQAAEILSSHPEARPLAGGHKLLLQANRKHIAGAILVDLGKVEGLSGISLQADGGLSIGAMTTLDTLIRDKIVTTQYSVLAAGTALIGDAQLRNRATVGGSLAEAHPESDLAALLLSLTATVHVRNGSAERAVPIEQFFPKPGQTALGPHDLITSIALPPFREQAGMAYEKFKHPATLFALCGVAAYVTRDGSGNFSFVQVAAAGALTCPARLQSVENALLGKPARDSSIAAAAVSLADHLEFRSDLFASGEYRRHLLQVLTGRALVHALAQLS